MNKNLAWLPGLLILSAVIYNPLKKAAEVKPVNKNISFAVYKSNPYSAKVYDNTSAQVHIIVEKVNAKGQHTVVWNKTLDSKCLSQYPSIKNALRQKITIPNVNEKKEWLVVDYTLTYNSKGSELQMHEGIILSKDNTSKVEISI
jgi:hypothetical protein